MLLSQESDGEYQYCQHFRAVDSLLNRPASRSRDAHHPAEWFVGDVDVWSKFTGRLPQFVNGANKAL